MAPRYGNAPNHGAFVSLDSAELAWDLADRLNKSLRFADMTTAEMADLLGVTPNTVDSWVHGKSLPRLTVLMQWAQHTQVPFEWLTGTETKQ